MLPKSTIVQPGKGNIIPSPAAPQGVSSTLMTLLRQKQQRDDAFANEMSTDFIGNLNEAGTKIQQEALDAFSAKWNTKYKDQRRLSTEDKIELARDKQRLTHAQGTMMASQRNYEAQMKKLETDRFGTAYETPESMPEIDWTDPNKNYLEIRARNLDELIAEEMKLTDPDTDTNVTQSGWSTDTGSGSTSKTNVTLQATNSPEKQYAWFNDRYEKGGEFAVSSLRKFQGLTEDKQSKYLKEDGTFDIPQFLVDTKGGLITKTSTRSSSSYQAAKINVVEPRTNDKGQKFWPVSTDPIPFTDKPYVAYDESGARVSPDDIPIIGSGQISEVRQMRTDDSGQRVVPVAQIIYYVYGDGKATPSDESLESLTQSGLAAENERQREIEMNEKIIDEKGRRSKKGRIAKKRIKVLNSNQYVNQMSAPGQSDPNIYNQYQLSQRSTRTMKTIFVPTSELGNYMKGFKFNGIEKTGEAEQMRSLY